MRCKIWRRCYCFILPRGIDVDGTDTVGQVLGLGTPPILQQQFNLESCDSFVYDGNVLDINELVLYEFLANKSTRISNVDSVPEQLRNNCNLEQYDTERCR